MRTVNAIMLGVVALGTYAVYRMLGSQSNAFDSTSLPDKAGPPGVPPPNSTVQTGPTLHVGLNRWYAGRFEEPIPAFLDQGAWTVSEFGTPEEAAPHMPPWAMANPGKDTRWFVATWTASKAVLTRPPGLVLFWDTMRPS